MRSSLEDQGDPGNSLNHPVGTVSGALKLLHEEGVRFSTVIDLGCSDGHFYLLARYQGLLPGAICLNVDANKVYQESLQAIQNVLGGHYAIAAISDHNGEIEITAGAHSYWNSVRPPGDPYWQRLNQQHGNKVRVKALTLDTLVEKFNLTGPFLLKLDIQGAERSALKGAQSTLQQTDVVICEADLDDFHGINRVLDDAGFKLFDIANIERLPDNALGWFYPIYVNDRLDSATTRAFWNVADTEHVIRAQIERRNSILSMNAQLLSHFRSANTNETPSK